MTTTTEPILRIPETVREDTAAFREQVRKFMDGRTSPVAFRAYRVPMGIYEQRTAGKYMVRVRIGAGLVTPAQLDRLAELSRTHGNGILHVTTRQDIQVHEVGIEQTPDVLEGLLEAGLSPRGGGGNTVRNVTACPRAGVCQTEVFDVSPYAVAAAEYLIADRSSFNLPRKYKIVFSGCPTDCAFASVADLGFFAQIKDGAKGFAVYAAGGLGSHPGVAVPVEEFVPADEIFQVVEAVKRLFDKHGDRSNKHRARLRYVLARLGAEEFVRLYRQERQALQADGLPYEAPDIRDVLADYAVPEAPERDVEGRIHVLPESTSGRVSVRLWLKNGDIPADDLSIVARLAAAYGQGVVRTTQLQDLLITGVAQEDVAKLEDELKGLSVDVFGGAGPKVVACAGAATCKLGLCLSQGLSTAITEKFAGRDGAAAADTAIRISGCPNCCGHHYISEVGLQGRAKRINGRLVPFYDVLVGGKTVQDDAHLGETVASVPAQRIPDLLLEASDGGVVRIERVRELAEKYADLGDQPLPEEFYHDVGSDEPFSLAGRGPGECGAGVMDVINVDIAEAKDAIKTDPATNESIDKALVAAARALLVTFGEEPGTDREIFAAFGKHLIEPGWVKPRTKELLESAVDWRMGDRDSLADLRVPAEELVGRVRELFGSLDANLKFTVEPIVAAGGDDQSAEAQTHSVDLRGVTCPMNFVKAKLALEKIGVGEILEVLLDDGEPIKNVPSSFADQGQEVLEVADCGAHSTVKVRRRQ